MLTWLLAFVTEASSKQEQISTLTVLHTQTLTWNVYSFPTSLSGEQRNLECKRGEVNLPKATE